MEVEKQLKLMWMMWLTCAILGSTWRKKTNDWAKVQHTHTEYTWIIIYMYNSCICLLIRSMLSKISSYVKWLALHLLSLPTKKPLLQRERELWKLLMLLWRTQGQGTRLATQTKRPNPTFWNALPSIVVILSMLDVLIKWYTVLLLLVFVHFDSLPASIHNMRVVSSRHTPDTAVLYMFHGQSDQDQYHFYKEVVRKLTLPPRKWVFSQAFTTRMPGADRVPWQTLKNSLGLQSPFDFRCFLHIYHITHITTTMCYLWYNKPFNIKLLAAWPKGFPSCTVIQLISRLPCWTIQMSD